MKKEMSIEQSQGRILEMRRQNIEINYIKYERIYYNRSKYIFLYYYQDY
jgi:hypothetical protein